jgi:hypothetical protein
MLRFRLTVLATLALAAALPAAAHAAPGVGRALAGRLRQPDGIGRWAATRAPAR